MIHIYALLNCSCKISGDYYNIYMDWFNNTRVKQIYILMSILTDIRFTMYFDDAALLPVLIMHIEILV